MPKSEKSKKQAIARVRTKTITAGMPIGEIISKYPKTIEIFLKHGLHCIGCHLSNLESLEIGAKAHGIDLKKILKELNAKVKENEKRK